MPSVALLRVYVEMLVPVLVALTFYAWIHWIALTAAARHTAPAPVAHTPPSPSWRHPEPLARWARALCHVIDAGGLWLDATPACAAAMLRCWNVVDVTSWRATLLSMTADTRDGIDAWDGVRAIRILMAGARVGWCKETFAWAATRAIGVELARKYASFADVGTDFVIGRRRWARLPLDGMLDDACNLDGVARIAEQRFLPPTVSFTAFFDAPAHPKLRDLDALRVWLGGAPAAEPATTIAPPPTPPLARCAFCRDVFRGRPRACPSCGAPTADATLTVERQRLRA